MPRRVLVIGAASGIGAATAARFNLEGDAVVQADLPRDGWVGAEGRIGIDVTSEESVHEGVASSIAAMGGLDVVVNCAGILGTVAPTLDLPADEFDRVLSVNLKGAFLVSHSVIPALLESDAGRLIHVASIAGKEGNPRMAAYSASKAGVLGLVKSLGKEFARTRLTVNAIAPASIDTPLIHEMSEERRSIQRDLIPAGRFGTPAEAAALISYIASEDAGFTTGFAYDLSGGRADY